MSRMFDNVIADVGGARLGEWDGVYGDPYSDLGVDMFGDVRLGDIPTPGPRADVPTSANVVTQAVATKVANGTMNAPETVLKKAVAVKRTGITPRPRGAIPFRLPTVTPRQKKFLLIGGAAVVVAYLLTRK